jgi:hypothetical protein
MFPLLGFSQELFLKVFALFSWAANCAANDLTNGVDLKNSDAHFKDIPRRKLANAAIIDKSNSNAVNLPPPFLPNTTAVPGSEGVIKSFILPDKKTGVVRHSNNICILKSGLLTTSDRHVLYFCLCGICGFYKLGFLALNHF